MSGPTLPSGQGARCPHCGDQHPPSYTHCPKTGRSLASGHGLIGRVIAGRYRILGQLGEGGMGEVFIAEHLRIGRKVALKRLHPELAADERAVQRFQREARAAAATGHQHIVEILDLGYADDHAPYLVMEYLRGASLADIIKEEKRLPLERTAVLLGQVLSALDAVHRMNIIHRDLKPDNVFVTRRPGVGTGEFVKVLDFGISKMKAETGAEALALTRTGVQMGTPFYMSPEQARGMREVDHRVDLYAVGVMLYECLTGRLPFASENYHALLQLILRSEPRPPSALTPGLAPAIDAVVLKAIGKDPDTRFQTALELLEALAPFGAERPSMPPSAMLDEVEAAPTVDASPRPTPRYFFAASDDWLPERARSGSIRPPLSLSQAPHSPAPRTVSAPPSGPLSGPISGTERTDPAAATATAARPSAPPRPFDPTVLAARASRPPPRPSTPPQDAALRAGPAEAPQPAPTGVAVDDTGGRASVRGSWFVAALAFLEDDGGPDFLESVLSRLPDDVRERLSGVILPMTWLPLGAFDALLKAAVPDDETLGRMGEAIADRELLTMHRLFVQTATPELALQRLPHLMRHYHLRGTAETEMVEPGATRVTLDLGVPEPVLHTRLVGVVIARLLELCGAIDPVVVVESCRGLGDARTRFYCTYKPA